MNGEYFLSPTQFWNSLCKEGPNHLVDYFLLEGKPHVFASWEEYSRFKKEVSQRLGVHPKSVVLIGSGRLGYSVSPETQKPKLWRPFGEESDLDVVVVDATSFDAAWRECLLWQKGDVDVKADLRYLTERQRDIYEGMIVPWHMPGNLASSAKWADAFDEVSTLEWQDCGRRTCKGFLFREWLHVEMYYAGSFNDLRRRVDEQKLPTPPTPP